MDQDARDRLQAFRSRLQQARRLQQILADQTRSKSAICRSSSATSLRSSRAIPLRAGRSQVI